VTAKSVPKEGTGNERTEIVSLKNLTAKRYLRLRYSQVEIPAQVTGTPKKLFLKTVPGMSVMMGVGKYKSPGLHDDVEK
jgi:methyl coenzyme M reductase subunit C-like uncharacterized protein (methanogenesis marker protein 7)